MSRRTMGQVCCAKWHNTYRPVVSKLRVMTPKGVKEKL